MRTLILALALVLPAVTFASDAVTAAPPKTAVPLPSSSSAGAAPTPKPNRRPIRRRKPTIPTKWSR